MLGLESLASDVFLEKIRSISQKTAEEITRFGDFQEKFVNTTKTINKAVKSVADSRTVEGELDVRDALTRVSNNASDLAEQGINSERARSLSRSLYASQIRFFEKVFGSELENDPSGGIANRISELEDLYESKILGSDNRGEINKAAKEFKKQSEGLMEDISNDKLNAVGDYLEGLIDFKVSDFASGLTKDLGVVFSEVVPRLSGIREVGPEVRKLVLESFEEGVVSQFESIQDLIKEVDASGDFTDVSTLLDGFLGNMKGVDELILEEAGGQVEEAKIRASIVEKLSDSASTTRDALEVIANDLLDQKREIEDTLRGRGNRSLNQENRSELQDKLGAIENSIGKVESGTKSLEATAAQFNDEQKEAWSSYLILFTKGLMFCPALLKNWSCRELKLGLLG